MCLRRDIGFFARLFVWVPAYLGSSKIKVERQIRIPHPQRAYTNMSFKEVPIGAHSTFRGREYVKKALSLADDEKQIGHVFQYECEVESDRKGDASNSAMAGEWIKRGPINKMMPDG
jgi:hypothetical protein